MSPCPRVSPCSRANHTGPGDTTRILLHAGDVSSHESFGNFREAVRANPLEVTAEKVDYRFDENRIEVTRYDAHAPQSFTLPIINGQALDLHPEAVYESPFLNGEFGSDQFTVTVGPIKRTLDFGAMPDAAPR